MLGDSETREKFHRRSERQFIRAEEELQAAIKAMLANHSAKGLLRSGATIRSALKIFEDSATAALDHSLSEAGKLLQHRGRNWNAALAGVAEALQEYLDRGPELLEPTVRLAGGERSPSTQEAVRMELAGTRARLGERLADFRDGWTAPVPKDWKDRHPLLFQLGLLLAGAAITLFVSYAAGMLQFGLPPNP